MTRNSPQAPLLSCYRPRRAPRRSTGRVFAHKGLRTLTVGSKRYAKSYAKALVNLLPALPQTKDYCVHTYRNYVIRTEQREDLQQHLHGTDIATGAPYAYAPPRVTPNQHSGATRRIAAYAPAPKKQNTLSAFAADITGADMGKNRACRSAGREFLPKEQAVAKT